jgi:hypothetical protein
MQDRSKTKNSHVSLLYPVGESPRGIQPGPMADALLHLRSALQALDALEAGLHPGPQRHRQEGLLVARGGIRRSWLAVSNLARDLDRQAWQRPTCPPGQAPAGST